MRSTGAQVDRKTATPVRELTWMERVERSIKTARDALLGLQHRDGNWCFELEADCTISAEYVLMMHFMDEIDDGLQEKIAVYIRARQTTSGGWPLFPGGPDDISCSVKCYWALKLAGDAPEDDHMVRARKAILERGGAARCNVFSRITMALFGQIPWRAVPFIPVEIVLLPRWFPFHLSKVSYWSRTVMVPLSILCSLKAKAKNPRGVNIAELFTTPPFHERQYFKIRSKLNRVFLYTERTSRLFEPFIPKWIRRRALKRAENWFIERLNGEDGLGGIFPAIVNTYESLHHLGYDSDHEYCVQVRATLRKLLVVRDEDAYCQPCHSPVWDSALVSLTLQETVSERSHGALGPSRNGRSEPEVEEALRRVHIWLARRQILNGPADWRGFRPNLRPGGWAFQYNNAFYPDLDDTSAVGWALAQGDGARFEESISRAMEWISGMQSGAGGFASFDADNTCTYLNHIPFADHGALLDPPTSDVTARCVALMGVLNRPEDRERLRTCLDYLWREQEEDGSWFGRWGTNYIYGTWSVLSALETLAEEWVDDELRSHVSRAAEWLRSVQREDGSWGEDNDTYFFPERAGRAREGTVFQTAWALLGLFAAGETDTPAVKRGIEFMMRCQEADGLWDGPWFTAPGFPRVFFLKYHGYYRYFPLWALARYRNESSGD